MSEQDRKDLLFGCQQQVDFIAASFIRKASDVREIREFLTANGGKYIKIISKIENQEGIDNFEEILTETDGVMVARGDL
jgi:pyruvate kinase